MYLDYLKRLSPPWLSLPGGLKYVGSLGEELDGVVTDGKFAIAEGQVETCTADALDYHARNSYLERYPNEPNSYLRDDIRSRWDKWFQSGNVAQLENELRRYLSFLGYDTRPKVYAYTDLLALGYLNPFGGGPVTIPGYSANGGTVWVANTYAGKPRGVRITQAGGVNTGLSINALSATELYIQLETDAGGVVQSTARKVAAAVNGSFPSISTVGWTGNGTGAAKPGTVFAPYAFSSFFFVSIPQPNPWTLIGNKWGGGGKWGDGKAWGVSGASAAELNIIKKIIRKWKPGHTSCRFIVVGLDGDLALGVKWNDKNWNEFYWNGFAGKYSIFPMWEPWEIDSGGGATELFNYSYLKEVV